MSDGLAIRTLTDIVIVLTLLEAIALALWHRRTGRGLATSDYALTLASGLWLMLALRSALAGTDAVWIALYLSAAGIAHGADLWRRWRK